LLNDPWPKTELAKAQLTALMETEPNENKLLHILKSTETYELERLPSTGVPIDMEIALSAQFVRIGESYGTVFSHSGSSRSFRACPNEGTNLPNQVWGLPRHCSFLYTHLNQPSHAKF